MRELANKISRELPNIDVKLNEPMSKHTSFKIGGPAEIFIHIRDTNDIPKALSILKQLDIPVHIMGGGSNILVSDSGVPGAVIKIDGGNINLIGDDIIKADAGCSKAAAAVFAAEAGLSGLEFMHGIPGTVGGGIYMNAGAYDGETAGVVESATACDNNGDLYSFKNTELQFNYRHSIFCERKDLIMLSANLLLKKGEPDLIKAHMAELMNRRRSRQPLEYPSAGSTFKRPDGYFAGKLIEDCGLKGFAVGGAKVSEKHAGFVINSGGATADDVCRLIDHIKNTVFNAFNVQLVCEIEMW